jgi:hypothetical protein
MGRDLIDWENGPRLEHRKLTEIVKEMIREERNGGFAFGTKERFLPFRRKDRSVQAKRIPLFQILHPKQLATFHSFVFRASVLS